MKKARTCNGCKAYLGSSRCLLGYRIEQKLLKIAFINMNVSVPYPLDKCKKIKTNKEAFHLKMGKEKYK